MFHPYLSLGLFLIGLCMFFCPMHPEIARRKMPARLLGVGGWILILAGVGSWLIPVYAR